MRSPGAGPAAANVDLFRQAGAHDPFASLTGLPRPAASGGTTPGSAKPSPTKPSPGLSPNASAGQLFSS